MTFNQLLEYGLITAIGVVLSFVFLIGDDPGFVDLKIEPTMEEFYEYPLQVWMGNDGDGDVVLVRYLVTREKTKLYMYNRHGKVVHKQHIALSPHKDGRERIEIYTWKLYRTEWTDRIGPGQYLIIVGTTHDKNGDSIEITIP